MRMAKRHYVTVDASWGKGKLGWPVAVAGGGRSLVGPIDWGEGDLPWAVIRWPILVVGFRVWVQDGAGGL